MIPTLNARMRNSAAISFAVVDSDRAETAAVYTRSGI